MVASEIRRTARENLRGKWGKAALISFCFFILEFVISFIEGLLSNIPLIGFLFNIAVFVISVPLSYGLLVSFIRLKRGDAVECFDFFTIATSNIKRVWNIVGNIILKVLPLFIATIILMICVFFSSSYYLYSSTLLTTPGNVGNSFGMVLSILFTIALIIVNIMLFIKVLCYSLSFNILYNQPELSNKEIVEQSSNYMTGNRWKLVWLQLTFLGWMILATFTFGIGYLWLAPYILVATIVFYEDVSKMSQNNKQTVSDSPEVIQTSDNINNTNNNDSDDQGPIILN